MVQTRALEFYSGIGGFHYSVKQSGLDIEVVQSFDIHMHANENYQFTFNAKPNQKNIESLTEKYIDNYNADMWLMSPPCQPYTRQKEALQKGSNDPRAKSFLHLLDIFPNLKNKPSYLVIENVVGFEKSDTRDMVVGLLEREGYEVAEFHLSPSQFGIPNQRMRYYLLAKKQGSFLKKNNTKEILKEIPGSTYFSTPVPSQTLQSFLEDMSPEQLSSFMVPEKIVLGSGMLFVLFVILDDNCVYIVYPDSNRSCCFTRSYAHKVEGAGSVLQLAPKDTPVGTDSASLMPLKLRYLSPTEIANILLLHGFPSSFKYSPTLTRQQCYRLIGNSLNVVVVSELVKYLFAEP